MKERMCFSCSKIHHAYFLQVASNGEAWIYQHEKQQCSTWSIHHLPSKCSLCNCQSNNNINKHKWGQREQAACHITLPFLWHWFLLHSVSYNEKFTVLLLENRQDLYTACVQYSFLFKESLVNIKVGLTEGRFSLGFKPHYLLVYTVDNLFNVSKNNFF